MINFITLQILNFFDYFHKRKILIFFESLKIKNLSVVFDIGAHKGETICFFLENFIVKKIFSFEASKINYKKLKENTDIIEKKFNNSNIIIENIALGSENKKNKFKQFYESSSSTFSNINVNSRYFKKKFRFLNKKKSNNFFYEEEIKMITLSEYLETNHIKQIDILKIDTEGYELEILKGLKKKIENVDIIYFEHHYDNMINKKYTFRDINEYLTKNNFQKIYRVKMPFRKTFEYIYRKKDNI